ncbi:hypothetical protein ACJROX_03885 [Pseudalkalibacillus sp. A8]|uniref:hypothetical protein n=1 Tax=Pseudalkalibacillus sp. A8 TaxID=3382641 RepID=UPI0038B5AEAF
MFLFLGGVILILIVIFVILYFFAPHSEMMHAFKTTRSFVITMLVMTSVGIYLMGAHFNGLHEAKWRTSWLYETTFDEKPVVYAGSESEIGLVLNQEPQKDIVFESELVTWKPYNELSIELTRKWGGVEPIEMTVSGQKENIPPYRYPIAITFPEDGIWKLEVKSEGKQMNEIIIEVE